MANGKSPSKRKLCQAGGSPCFPLGEACIQVGRLGQGRCRVQMVEHVGHMLGRRWWCGVRIETGGNTGTPEPTNWPEQTHLDLQLSLGWSQVNTKHEYLQLLNIPTDWQVDHFRPEEQHRLGAKKETSLVELRNLLVYYSPTLLACSVYWSRWKGQHECCGKWSFQIFIIDIKWIATSEFCWLWG